MLLLLFPAMVSAADFKAPLLLLPNPFQGPLTGAIRTEPDPE